MFAFLAPISFWLIIHSYGNFDGRHEVDLFLHGTWIVAIISLGLVFISRRRHKTIFDKLHAFMQTKQIDISVMKEVMEQLYIGCDFNDPKPLSAKDIGPLIEQKLEDWAKLRSINVRELIFAIFKEIKDLADNNLFLKHEEANIIILWYQILKNDSKMWRWSRLIDLLSTEIEIWRG